jgi:hypothetical protein
LKCTGGIVKNNDRTLNNSIRFTKTTLLSSKKENQNLKEKKTIDDMPSLL